MFLRSVAKIKQEVTDSNYTYIDLKRDRQKLVYKLGGGWIEQIETSDGQCRDDRKFINKSRLFYEWGWEINIGYKGVTGITTGRPPGLL